MMSRAAIVVTLVLLAGLYSSRAGGEEAMAPRQPLAFLPMQIGEWQGEDQYPLADDVVASLGVDDYVNRRYARREAGPVALYAGYYASQRQGDTIHSPRNCLPGAGWQPVAAERVRIAAGGRSIRVNRYVIQKGLDRQVVLYWYQGRGRTVASEYTNKLMLMLDAARLHRTNGGLVRLIAPVVTTVDDASRELESFTAALYPRLPAFLP